MSYSLGVDLGTTFVAAALAASSRVELFTLGDRSEVTPAVVYAQEDGTLLTGEAVNSLREVSSPDRVARTFKRRLGDPTPMMLGGHTFPVTTMLGTLLKDVLERVAESEGGQPERVVLTHPANWGPFRRALFEEVAQYAGVTDALMVSEPEAAAAHYAATRQLAEGQTVAVYDLGGGTFDATVLRAVPGGVEILGIPEGVEKLGGIDFDDALMEHLNYRSKGALTDMDMSDRRNATALARLRQDCVLAKEALSVDTEAVIPVFLPDRHFDVRVTRGEFEDLIHAQIDSTIAALSGTLRSARVEPAELSAVLLVGGSSRIPLIARMVSAALGRPTVVDTHPKYAVALGAATLAAASSPAAAGAQVAAGSPVAAPAAAGSPAPAAPVPALPRSAQRTAVPARPAALASFAPPGRRTAPPGQPVRRPLTERRTPPAPGLPPRLPSHLTPPPQPLPRVHLGPPPYPARHQLTPPGRSAPPRRPMPPPTSMRPVPVPPLPAEPAIGAHSTSRRILQLRRLAAAVTMAAAIAVGATGVHVLARPAPANVPVTSTELALTTSQVTSGSSYVATATGFQPGEPVRFSWTGPASGSSDALPTDPSGTNVHGPIIKDGPPGNYLITATGLTSGRSATAPLVVVAPAPGPNPGAATPPKATPPKATTAPRATTTPRATTPPRTSTRPRPVSPSRTTSPSSSGR